jgi:hypothetical protein
MMNPSRLWYDGQSRGRWPDPRVQGGDGNAIAPNGHGDHGRDKHGRGSCRAGLASRTCTLDRGETGSLDGAASAPGVPAFVLPEIGWSPRRKRREGEARVS